jgi:hypothetical protein
MGSNLRYCWYHTGTNATVGSQRYLNQGRKLDSVNHFTSKAKHTPIVSAGYPKACAVAGKGGHNTNLGPLR